jgi:transcription-repair coupling factor (superfamily II helicase)
MRGAGEWLGESQSGSGFSPSVELMEKARKLCERADLEKHRERLKEYYDRLHLNKVTLN